MVRGMLAAFLCPVELVLCRAEELCSTPDPAPVEVLALQPRVPQQGTGSCWSPAVGLDPRDSGDTRTGFLGADAAFESLNVLGATLAAFPVPFVVELGIALHSTIRYCNPLGVLLWSKLKSGAAETANAGGAGEGCRTFPLLPAPVLVPSGM